MATAKDLERQALAHHRAGRLDEAAQLYRAALAVDPQSASIHNNLGIILSGRQQFEEAVRHLEAAIAIEPDYAIAHNNLGTALNGLNRPKAAIAAYRRAAGLDPRYVVAHANVARLLRAARRDAELIDALSAAHAALPHEPEFLAQLIVAKWRVFDWDGLDTLHDRLRAMVAAGARVPAFMFLGVGRTEAELLDCARNWTRLVSVDRARRAGLGRFEHRPGPRERLRIGYLSGDFREHACAYLIAEHFELHDRTRFQVIAYSYGSDDGGATRRRIAAGVDRFVDVSTASDAELARRLHADGVDIVVDMMGHTVTTRLGVLASRPAPIQIHYLGFAGTTGADFIDYLIVDDYVVPEGHDEHYSEALVRLTLPYLANDRHRAVAPAPFTRAECGLPDTGIVFCAFNGTKKISYRSFDSYMRILGRVAGSVLWLLDEGDLASDNARRRAAGHGIDPRRLIFAPRMPVAQHLRRYECADLFLDTVPGTAHTTASDAMWMGCPLVTVVGGTIARRAPAAMVLGMGLPELVVESESAFEELAAGLGRDPGRLAVLRDRVKAARARAPTFDSGLRTRQIEAAFRRMWDRYAAGEAPRGFTVE